MTNNDNVTLKKVYDRNVVNKYLLLGVIIYNLIDYISICTDAELFIIYICMYVDRFFYSIDILFLSSCAQQFKKKVYELRQEILVTILCKC